MATQHIGSPRTASSTASGGDRRSRSPANIPLKPIAVGILLLLAGLLVFVGAAETAAGESSGVLHFPEALAVVAFSYFAWRRPRAAGLITLALVTALTVLNLLAGSRGVSTEARLVYFVLGFGPVFLAGFLLLLASRSSGR